MTSCISVYNYLYRYDLICLARGYGAYGGNVGDMWDLIDPNTGHLGYSACFASGW
jgi:hypothetical protein